jgi:hypothetical protein
VMDDAAVKLKARLVFVLSLIGHFALVDY